MPAGMVRPRASQVTWALRGQPDAPTGVWLGASLALDRPVPTSEPYPHICGLRLVGATGRQVRVSGLWVDRDGEVHVDCAACAERHGTQP